MVKTGFIHNLLGLGAGALLRLAISASLEESPLVVSVGWPDSADNGWVVSENGSTAAILATPDFIGFEVERSG